MAKALNSVSAVSVILPCFNRREKLRRAISSVANQSLRPKELVICDDGSTEDIGAVVREFEERLSIVYIRIANSGGPARPRNVASSVAKGEWLALLDSDDTWSTGKIEKVTATLRESDDIVYHRLNASGGSGELGRHRKHLGGRPPAPDDALYDLLTLGNPIPASAAVIRKTLYARLGGMDEFTGLEDFDFWIRAAAAGAKFRLIPQVFGNYWCGDDNRSLNTARNISAIQRIYSRYEGSFDRRRARHVAAYRDYCLAIQYLRACDVAAARRLFRAAANLRTVRQRLVRAARLLTV